MSRRTAAILVLAACFAVLMFNSGGRFTIGLLLKPMADDLQWTRSTLSAAVTVFMVLSALALPFAGRAVDRYGAGLVVGVSVAVLALGTALMSVIQTPLQMLVVYGVVIALGSAGTSISPIGVLVNRWFPHRLGLANSVAISGMGVGQLLIITVLASQLTDLGWRGAFLWLGVVTAVVVLPLVAFAARRPPAPAPAAASPSTVAPRAAGAGAEPGARRRDSALRTPRLWTLFGVYGICGFQDFFVATHVVAFALDQGLEAGLAGNMLAFMGLFGLAGVLLTGAVTDRRGPLPATVGCFVLRIGLFALVLASGHTWAIMAFALLYGATFWATAPLTVVFVRQSFGTARLGTLSGTVTMVHHAAGGLGAYAGAAVYDTTGSYADAFWLLLAMSVAATVLCVGLREPPPERAGRD